MLKRELLYGFVAAAIGLFIALIVLEGLIRLYHGELLNVNSQLPPPPNRVTSPIAQYHPQLGWVPKTGAYEKSVGERWIINDAGLRNNGTSFSSTKRPILAVGDSFTFGVEVLDHATWPAQLEHLLQSPVLNGGVFAYGVDQAFLRATLLMNTYEPKVVLLAFIGDDINRTEFSYYSAWKPYFEYVEGELMLRNTPVPTGQAPEPQFATMRTVLSYSFLCSALLRRFADRWWYYGAIEKRHDDGEAVTVELFTRLDALLRAKNARLAVIALGTNGRIGGNSRTRAIIERASQRGIQVLDLASEIEKAQSNGQQNLFATGGHYSPTGNKWVAARVAKYLRALR